MYRVGVDIGGTFTDIFLFNEDTGEIFVKKAPSTKRPEEAVIKGLKGLRDKEIKFFIHGTTIGTNVVLEHKGAKTGMVTTSGFKDIIEIGRQSRGWPKPKVYDFTIERPKPLAERHLRFEVSERVNHKGEVIKKLKKEEVKRLTKDLKELESLAICYLFSYINPIHEKKTKEIISKRLPDLLVSTSSEVLPEYREYERFSTTLLNAYIQPVMTKYLKNLKLNMESNGIYKKIYIMQSNGGIMTEGVAREKSVFTLLSGPAAGVIGANFFGRLTGYGNLISFDMGGTSTDVSLIEKNCPRLTSEGYVGEYPARIPMIEINTVGAGGGSIAWVDKGGALRVGPESAGATPGPACYGKGSYVTVTDANLVLGYLNPEYLLSGKMKIYKDRAERAVSEIGKRMNMDVVKAAYGILEVANSNIIRAIKVISTEKGYDPRAFSLICFGGAGPMHAGKIAKEMGIPKVIIPLYPGITSAIGLLVADMRHDFSLTKIKRLDYVDTEFMEGVWGRLERKAIKTLKEEGVSEEDILLSRSIDMRYQGQSFEINVKAPLSSKAYSTGQASKDGLEEDFKQEHKRVYGYSSNDPIEVVNFRVSAFGKIKGIRIREIGKGDLENALLGKRIAFFEGSFFETPIYRREKLSKGNIITGPAIIEQYDSTTVLNPGDEITVDKYGNMIMQVGNKDLDLSHRFTQNGTDKHRLSGFYPETSSG